MAVASQGFDAERAVRRERAVLGCLLESPGLWSKAGELTAADFQLDDHRKIFRAIADLNEHSCLADIVSVSDKLGERVPAHVISGLIDGAVTEDFHSYVRHLRESTREKRFYEMHASLGEAKTAEDRLALADLIRGVLKPESGATAIRRLEQIPNVMVMEIPPILYLVDGMISRKTITLWTGSDGTAKTFLAQKMAVAVATGSQFLGRRCQRAPVLYLDYENPNFAVRDRLDLMAGGPIENLYVWGTWLEQQPPQIGNDLLLTIAKESKPLIIVDPFRYAHGAEENDSTEMMAVMQNLRHCAAAGSAVIIVHHPAKTEGSTGRGSTAIKGAADVAFLQEMSDESGLITLKCTKNRFGERMTVTIRPDYDEGIFEVTDSPAFTKRTEECEKLLQIITETPGLSQNLWWKKSGMMKARFVALVKANNGRLWQEEKVGSSLRYLPLVFKTQNNSENNRTGQGVQGCSPVLSPLGENREQPALDPSSCSRTGDGEATRTLPSCPACGSFALYKEKNGDVTCETCEVRASGS